MRKTGRDTPMTLLYMARAAFDSKELRPSLVKGVQASLFVLGLKGLHGTREALRALHD